MGHCTQLHTFKLSNNLRVRIIPRPFLHSVSVSIAINCGSRHEGQSQWGLSHFLEHMLFRGSNNYPTGRQLTRAFEQAGGTINAATWRDQTVLTATAQPQHLHATLHALADMIQSPKFIELDIERGVVLEELAAELNEDGSDSDIHNLSRSHIWANHPLGKRIVGSAASIQTFTAANVRSHHRRFYVANNMVIAIAGCVTNDLQPLLEQLFGQMRTGPIPLRQGPPVFNHGAPILQHTSSSQYTVQLALSAPSQQHPHFLAANLLSRILDDGLSSRLPDALSFRRGLVYDLTSGLDCYQDCGSYDVQLAVAPEHLEEALAQVSDVLLKIGHDGVTLAELECAKERDLFEYAQILDIPEELAETVATHTLFDRPVGLSQQKKALQQLDIALVNRVARLLFIQAPRHISLIGPKPSKNLPQWQKLTRNINHLGRAGAARRRTGRVAGPG